MSDPADPCGGGFIKRLQCRGAEPGQVEAPIDSAGERDFLGERLSLYFSATLFAAAGFFLAGRIIYVLFPSRVPYPVTLTEPFLLFHLAAIALLLVMWLAVRQPGLSPRTLLFMDAGGTIGDPGAHGRDVPQHARDVAARVDRAARGDGDPPLPRGHRSERAAPHRVDLDARGSSDPHRRLRGPPEPTPELSAGAAAANSLLWALLAVLLSTIVSYVTFRLRNSVARARRLGQYTLKEKIGEGGMGVVYRAEHEMLRRPTAIKLLPPGTAGEDNLRRFEREVQLTARLTSPHTVSVYDFGRTPDGLFYYVMEYPRRRGPGGARQGERTRRSRDAPCASCGRSARP